MQRTPKDFNRCFLKKDPIPDLRSSLVSAEKSDHFSVPSFFDVNNSSATIAKRASMASSIGTQKAKSQITDRPMKDFTLRARRGLVPKLIKRIAYQHAILTPHTTTFSSS
jgi:hypothetical protein